MILAYHASNLTETLAYHASEVTHMLVSAHKTIDDFWTDLVYYYLFLYLSYLIPYVGYLLGPLILINFYYQAYTAYEATVDVHPIPELSQPTVTA